MAIITITSDWGIKDHYLAAVKGAIYSKMPDVTVVDVSHQILRYDIFQAAFVLKNCFRNFPPGSVHIIAVNSEASVKTPHKFILYKGQWFIGADNGVFSLLWDDEPESIYEITTFQDSDLFTFPARDVFAKVACHLARGEKPEEMGKAVEGYNQVNVFKPVVDKNVIRGVVIYIDGYENAITNIRREDFTSTGKGRKFTLAFRGEEIKAIHTAYSDVPPGEIVALFGATGFLEIAMNRGNASGLLGLEINETVRIEFEDK
jgi:S-adenosylmethionine hydrolase